MTDTSRLLLTGGCGFIGVNLVHKLLAGGYEVVVFDNLSHPAVPDYSEHGVVLLRGDIRDREALEAAMGGCQAVVHLAASGSVVDSVADPEYNFEVNARGTFNVLQAARTTGVGHVVFASTGGALMGNASPPVDESSLPRPIAPYGASKLTGEGYCSAFSSAFALQTTVLRFANVYGPHSLHKKGVITNFIKALLDGNPLLIYGDGTASRDFLHVDDLCEGIVAALQSSRPGNTVMHLASGKETTMRELADLLRNASGHPDHPVELHDGRVGEVARNFADATLARRMIGFSPRVMLEEGLRQTLEWFRQAYPAARIPHSPRGHAAKPTGKQQRQG